jgi:hypothetical protein
MQNLFWKKSNGKVISAKDTPFQTEDEFERYIHTVKEILSDIFIIKRQVRAGGDIPDMVGIDRDNFVVIIENKNVVVDEEILPQILRYAIWAETQPDSVKALWLDAKGRPEDIKVDWDSLKIRVIVLAPSIKITVPRLLKKVDYKVDLIELKKFIVGREEFILVHKLEEPESAPRRGARGLEDYDRAYYEEWANPRSVEKFFALEKELERIMRAEAWNLEPKFNGSYMGFKYGFFNVFGVQWVGTKSFEVFVKLPKSKFAEAKRLCPYPSEYDERWKQVTIRVDEKLIAKKLIPVFRQAYKHFVGETGGDRSGSK